LLPPLLPPLLFLFARPHAGPARQFLLLLLLQGGARRDRNTRIQAPAAPPPPLAKQKPFRRL
jgi:hypothetical protein